MDIIPKYNIYIQQIYKDLINSKKEIDNFDLAKIFEYFCAIQLSDKYKQQFYEYNDIDPNFKEDNKLTRNDTGIDLCNLIDIIVQCKLRKDSLSWFECTSFFASQNMFDLDTKKIIIRWPNLIIARNKESKLSHNLKQKQDLFTDITFSRNEIISYCDNLLKNPVKLKQKKEVKFKLRDYQIEAIKIINDNENSVICLPTGCGKNVIMIYSMDVKKRYLILVPRIILMDQFKDELIKHKPELKNKIQTIGDNSNDYDKKKTITICVYNSIKLIEKYCNTFDKIFIDEAHHINNPEIYEDGENKSEDDNESIIQDDSEDDDNESIIQDDSEDDEKDSIIEDDSEDEIKNTSGYNKIIKDLSKYKNNIYLSATIDKIDGFAYYNKDIRNMIDNKYLSDYTINIPIFSDDPTNRNICEHLINNYRNIIIYCNSQKEGKIINDLLNSIRKGCSKYIDCTTTKTKRNDIIDSYKNDKIAFLVNVRILVEGFDAPITKGVCFIHLPSSKTTIIQIIGRALRLHPLKTFANIILPFSSKDDESNINKFLKILASNDTRIKKSYERKIDGGYISIEKIKCNDLVDNNIEFRYEMIYDSMGVITNAKEIWLKKLEMVKEYIDKYEKRPTRYDENKNIKILGKWITDQLSNYNKHKKIMKNREIRIVFEKFLDNYKKYFLSNKEEWILKLKEVINYIEKYNKRPTEIDNDYNIKILGRWLVMQFINHRKNIYIMKDKDIRKQWDNFINNYKNYFLSDNEKWIINYNKLIIFIEKYNKRPTSISKNYEEKSLGIWFDRQTKLYKEKKYIMKDPIIYNKWKELIKKYGTFSINDKFDITFNNLIIFIETNNRRPIRNSKNKTEKHLNIWLSNQINNYKNKNQSMSTEDRQNKWKKFIEDPKFSIYFN